MPGRLREQNRTQVEGPKKEFAVQKGLVTYNALLIETTYTYSHKTQERCGSLAGENPGAFRKALPTLQFPCQKVPKPWQG